MKTTKEDEKETREATVSPAAAIETSVDAAVEALFTELDGVFTE